MQADAAATIRLDVQGSELRLIGELGFATVTQVLEAGRRAIGAMPAGHAVLNLSEVDRTDTAGLALVVDWMRAARARKLELAVRAVPRQLAAIARVSDLEDLIPGADANAA